MPTRLASKAALAHLARRAGFGPDLATWGERAGDDPDAALRAVLASLGTPAAGAPAASTSEEADFDPYAPAAIQTRALSSMLWSPAPLRERLALVWHDHFATSDAKVRDPGAMWRQWRLLHARGSGRLEALVVGLLEDVAMLRWLDGDANRKGQPNENLARELLELFLLGRGRYDEHDVREVARALTGATTRGGAYAFDPALHDDGEKTVLGARGRLDAAGVVRLLVHSDACRRHVARRLLASFVTPAPDEADVVRVARRLAQSDGDVGAGLAAVFEPDHFFRREHAHTLVRGPVETLVAALRAAGAREVPSWAHAVLARAGQTLFRPPSVKGWPAGARWLTTATTVARVDLASRVADGVADGDADQVVETAYAGDVPSSVARVLRGVRGRRRVAIALAAPEFQVA